MELAATEAWAEEGAVRPRPRWRRAPNAAFTVEAVDERERVTDHDVAAFVDVVAASVGEHGRWIHYGLTSSDVLDTALALQLRQAGEIVLAGARAYRDALIERALEHRDTLCVGRPTASTPSRRPSACASPASPSRPTATSGGLPPPSTSSPTASSRARSAPTPRSPPRSRRG